MRQRDPGADGPGPADAHRVGAARPHGQPGRLVLRGRLPGRLLRPGHVRLQGPAAGLLLAAPQRARVRHRRLGARQGPHAREHHQDGARREYGATGRPCTVKTLTKQLFVACKENSSMVLPSNFVGNTNDFLCITNNFLVTYQQTVTKKLFGRIGCKLPTNCL